MSVVTIVACGESAKDWIPRGHTIAVNDAWKWGKPTESLLICNRPQEFRGERMQTIINSKPKTFYSHKSNWAYAFPNWKKINLVTWYGVARKGQQYSSGSSPFIAISLAWNLGAEDIILWGCDFMNHATFNPENPYRDKEVSTYMELIRALEAEGVKVWLGAKGTAFDGLIPVYNQRVMETFENIKKFCEGSV